MAAAMNENVSRCEDLTPLTDEHCLLDTGSVLEGPELTATAMSENLSRCEDLTPLTDEHCLLATPWLKGMDLKTKEWGKKLGIASSS